MALIRLIHWDSKQAKKRARFLGQQGFQVRSAPASPPRLLEELQSEPPDAVEIDLSRIASRCRDLAIAIRLRESTRTIPIVLMGGQPEKVATIQELLPDATFSDRKEAARDTSGRNHDG